MSIEPFKLPKSILSKEWRTSAGTTVKNWLQQNGGSIGLSDTQVASWEVLHHIFVLSGGHPDMASEENEFGPWYCGVAMLAVQRIRSEADGITPGDATSDVKLEREHSPAEPLQADDDNDFVMVERDDDHECEWTEHELNV